MSGLGYISAEEPGKCELCGEVDELRPYGPNGENICHPCGMKNEDITKRQFSRHVFGEPVN